MSMWMCQLMPLVGVLAEARVQAGIVAGAEARVQAGVLVEVQAEVEARLEPGVVEGAEVQDPGEWGEGLQFGVEEVHSLLVFVMKDPLLLSSHDISC